ncbi:soluble lamin-associated protein of 75 kDa-like isoform X2 [Homalodisca vitripennis]|uniref:soluble lamin-associated protein of 75 kDa-like isoform X2 n=1 Tax=Homalodisca vitripennis TaxID=197043 RepID=UPI001EEA445F|nr:soluble lamin-associated protein of 75 kDa-like isoform X2 [Homalodisca vitripennis]
MSNIKYQHVAREQNERCCNAATYVDQTKPSLPGLQVLYCCSCGHNADVIYEGVTQHTEDFLQDTSKPKGCHWIEAKGLRDKAVHHVLSQVVYKPDDSKGEVPYDVPDSDDIVKLLWDDHRVVGFYTIKPQGPGALNCGLPDDDDGIPTLDTAYIRPSHRGRGLGLILLQDLVDSYPGSDFGLSHPLSDSMWMVVKKFLEQNAELRRKMWLVKDNCREGNKTLIWFCLHMKGLLSSR